MKVQNPGITLDSALFAPSLYPHLELVGISSTPKSLGIRNPLTREESLLPTGNFL